MAEAFPQMLMLLTMEQPQTTHNFRYTSSYS